MPVSTVSNRNMSRREAISETRFARGRDGLTHKRSRAAWGAVRGCHCGTSFDPFIAQFAASFDFPIWFELIFVLHSCVALEKQDLEFNDSAGQPASARQSRRFSHVLRASTA